MGAGGFELGPSSPESEPQPPELAHRDPIPLPTLQSAQFRRLCWGCGTPGAAGAVEALACIVALTTGNIPPTINHFTDDPELDEKINFTFNTAQEREVNFALSNTFGFGGHNSTVIFKKI